MLKKKEMDTWGWEMIADAKIQQILYSAILLALFSKKNASTLRISGSVIQTNSLQKGLYHQLFVIILRR